MSQGESSRSGIEYRSAHRTSDKGKRSYRANTQLLVERKK